PRGLHSFPTRRSSDLGEHAAHRMLDADLGRVVAAERGAEQRAHALDELAHVHHGRPLRLLAAEAHQVASQLDPALGGLVDLVGGAPRALGKAGVGTAQLVREADHDGEDVAEVVRDARGHAPERLEPSGLERRLLERARAALRVAARGLLEGRAPPAGLGRSVVAPLRTPAALRLSLVTDTRVFDA